MNSEQIKRIRAEASDEEKDVLIKELTEQLNKRCDEALEDQKIIEQKDKRIAELENLLQQYVWEQEEIFNENKKAADWHNNNVSGVGQTIEYMSYPPLPKMVEEAKQLLTK